MSPVSKILFWWLMFGGTHVIGSSVAVRTRVIGAVGLPAFKGLYSVVAFATFIPLWRAFAQNKHAGAVLFPPHDMLGLVAQGLMLLALVAFAQAAATPNPMTTVAAMSGKFTSEPRGIQRITRHPANMAFFLFAIAHCLTNPFVGDIVFFGGFAVYAIVSALHQDARVLASGPEEFKSFHAQTSVVPFGAIVAGKQKFNAGEYNIPALAVSVILFAVLRIFHGRIFGGFAVS